MIHPSATDPATLRTFEALDAITRHMRTCPRWWESQPGHVLHCQEWVALSDAFHAVMVPLLHAHQDSVTDVFQLDAEITRFHTSWRLEFEVWQQQRRRRWQRQTHTPIRHPRIAVRDDALQPT